MAVIQSYFNTVREKKTTSYLEITVAKGLWIYKKSIFKDLSYSSKIRTYL